MRASQYLCFPLLLLALSLSGSARAGLAVQDLTAGQTPAGLVTALLGPGVSASNITYNGASLAAGTFSGGNGILGFNQGIVLSTGEAMDVAGPNNDTQISTGFGLPGDPDLSLLALTPTADASILEFDFIPAGSQLYFQYVFASDEYPEYVGAYNDAFGFFINGVNTALIPGSSTPVSIDTVNASTNSSYYIDNTGGALNTQMDGLTIVMGVTVTVNAGVVNHIKIGIADAGDDAVDSVVFLKAGSFSAPSPTPTPSPDFSPTASPTVTLSSTVTLSPTVTLSSTVTPTFSPSPTVTMTLTASPTSTITPTFSPSLTVTMTLTASPTSTITPTWTETPLPLLLHLLPANPDPASQDSYLPYFISVDSHVDIEVFTVAGEKARAFSPEWQAAGYHEERWDLKNSQGMNMASGIYIWRVHVVSAHGEDKSDFSKCAVLR